MTRRDQRGFTLIELLVALLIVAVLVAIGVAQYRSAKTRAQDREAMVAARTAHVALVLRHQREGDYRATAAALADVEPALRDAPGLRVAGDDAGFEVSVASRAGDRGGGRFTITLRPDGTLSRSCEHPDQGGCDAGGGW